MPQSKKRTIPIIALCLILFFSFNANAEQTTIVLTDANPDTTITTGTTATVYGSSGANHVTIESGANVKLMNFPGSNIITIKADSSNFTVSRSGATVTFQGTDGTLIKMPATKTSQIIAFSNCQSGLVINAGNVKLGEQVVSSVSSAVSSCAASGLAETLSPQIVFTEEKGVFILGDTISWYLEGMESVAHEVKWTIDGQPVEQEPFTPAEVGSYRLNAEITLSVTNEVINVARTILVDEMTPIASVQAGSEGAELLVLDTDSGLDGARIEVPAGAVAANTEIVLSRSTIDAMPYTGSEPLSPVLELQPAGTVFSKPVRIRIPFDPEQIEAGTDILIERLSDGQLDYLTPLMVDTQAKEIVFETEHFSTFRPVNSGFFTGDKTEGAKQIIQELRDFMRNYSGVLEMPSGFEKVYWNANISDDDLVVILNRGLNDSGDVTPYTLFDLYRKMKIAYNAAQNGSPNALSTTIRSLYPKASSITEFSQTMEKLKTLQKGGDSLIGQQLLAKFVDKVLPAKFAYKTLGVIVNIGYLWQNFCENQCLGRVAQQAKDWVYAGVGVQGLMDEFKNSSFTDNYYWPVAIGGGTCGDMPSGATVFSLRDDFYRPIYMFWETVKAFENGKVSDDYGNNAETALKDIILAAAQNPSLISTNTEFTSDSPYFYKKISGLNSKTTDSFVVQSDVKKLEVVPEPYSVNGSGVYYEPVSVRILTSDGAGKVIGSGTTRATIYLKSGLNIFEVEVNIKYKESDSSGNEVVKYAKTRNNYQVRRVINGKQAKANSLNSTTATRTKTNNIKTSVSVGFTSNDTSRSSDTRSAAVVSEIPKASYAIDIKCGSYNYQVGSDGKLIVPASEAEDAALSNCSARVYGTGAETDEDEIIESTFTIDLKSALKAANATELPTDRAVMGIYKINGTKVSKPRQEQDITAGNKVDYIYYIPTGATVLAYDLDANGAFRSSPDVTVTPVTVSGYTGFYTYSVTYSSGGTFQPLMKVRINGVESTASAPEVNVVPAGVSAITVAVSPQTTTTEVNKSVSLTAAITGDYDSIKWQKVQGPASPASVGGSTTNKFSFTLPTAGTYIFAAKACNGSYCVSGEATVTATAQGEEPSGDTFTNSLGMTFNLIPAGTFTMGSPEDELGRGSNETQHQVTLTNDYYMQTTEVTQGQWKAVMGSNPSSFQNCGDNCPVEQVSWNDIQNFITKLNGMGQGTYALPTEAQWEYAARAGSTTAFANGGITETGWVYDTNLDAIGWYWYYNSAAPTHSVAGKLPNNWGLYDMHGNVWEWCNDWYGSYSSVAATDPVGPGTGYSRVRRGGSGQDSPDHCRSAYRASNYQSDRASDLGFRLVCSAGHQ